MVLNCLSSLTGTSISIDGEETGRKCTKLNIEYFQTSIKRAEVDSKSFEAGGANDIIVSTKL